MTFEEVEMNNAKAGIELIDRQIQIARYSPIKELCREARILDLGCGAGFSSNLMLEWGANSVVGVDIDEELISKANYEYSKKGICFVNGFAERISEIVDLDEFDGITFVDCLEHVVDPELVLRALRSVVRSHSWLYITVNNSDWSFHKEGINLKPLRSFTKIDFATLANSILGNPNETGDGHAFLGFSTLPDKIDSKEDSSPLYQTVIPNNNDHLNSEDSAFYYSLWGDVDSTRGVVGNPASMKIYTAIHDAEKIRINIADLNAFAEKSLVYKYQQTLESLAETQNKLRAVSLLIGSISRDSGDKNTSTLVWLANSLDDYRRSTLEKTIAHPPRLIVGIYQLLPLKAKEVLRTLRRRLLR